VPTVNASCPGGGTGDFSCSANAILRLRRRLGLHRQERDTVDLDLDDALDAHDLENAPDPRGWTVFPRDERLPRIGF
jgi:hypothetical protein